MKKENLKKSLLLNNSITLLKKNNFFNLENDKEAIKAYELYVSENLFTQLKKEEKIEWLLENNYYEAGLLDAFTKEQFSEIANIVYETKFEFQTYMSITKFYEAYAMKTDNGKCFIENFQDRVLVTALFLAKNDFEFAKNFADSMIKQIYQPATPTFSNAGKKRCGKLVSCFLLEADDSLNSINYIISTSMQLSKIGGGVAINLSKLRAKGSTIKNIDSAASGIVPILKILENVFDYADQLGTRRGSGAAYLNVFHLDLMDFIDCKKINADEKSRIQTLSIGLLIPDKFIQLAKENKDFFIFDPHQIFKKYGLYFSELNMDEWYEVFANDDEINKKSLSARFVLNKIAQTQFESGYPYVIYIDHANKQNPLKELGQIKMSNLCTEIFQIQSTSTINDYGKPDDIKYDVSCNLGSLNVVNLFKNKNFEKTIEVAINALSNVADLSSIDNAPGVKKANEDLKSIGLGVMNFAGFLIEQKIPYDSEQAIELADVLFAAINYYSLLASAKIAQKKQKTFLGFEKSDYATGKYFDKYIETLFSPQTEKIQEIFKDIVLPTQSDWKNLRDFVKKHGVYNAYRLAIAPTQSISYLHGATASIHPIIDLIETRLYGKSVTYFPMPFLSLENKFSYKSAYLLNQMKIIDLVSTIQKHIDQGISTVLYVTNKTSSRDLVKLYLYAHHKNLKSLYYTRTKNLEIHECLSCSA